MTPPVDAWDELVTAALLGTERRALPADLPDPVARLARAQTDRSRALLDAAAGYAAYRQAGARPGSAPELPLAPRQELGLAPGPAQRLLAALLSGPDTALVEEWVRTCVSRGLGVCPGLWAALATASAAPAGPDRALVGAALGQRGRAFLAMNPRWRAVAGAPPLDGPDKSWSAALTEEALGPVRVTRSLGRLAVVAGADDARRDPDEAARLLTAIPAPWRDEVAHAALRHLAAGRTSPAASRRLAAVLARRSPLTVRPLVGRLAAQERQGSAARGLADAERVLALRADIEHAFDTPEETP